MYPNKCPIDYSDSNTTEAPSKPYEYTRTENIAVSYRRIWISISYGKNKHKRDV
jgi:hypothetical protein